MDNTPFVENKSTFRTWMKEHQSGLYLTIIFHLLLLIGVTAKGISVQLDKSESVFIFDFSEQQAAQAILEKQLLEKQQELQELQEKQQVQQEVDQMVRQAVGSRERPRNLTVNTADRNATANQQGGGGSNPNDLSSLIAESQALQGRLDASRRQMETKQGSEPINLSPGNTETKPTQKEVYQGPTVLSFTLAGRKNISLPVPVYKCQGGGDVTVSIEVNRQGYVTNATIQNSVSTNNDCLHEAAKRAAMRSRFTADNTADEKQKGEIVYRFIAQ